MKAALQIHMAVIRVRFVLDAFIFMRSNWSKREDIDHLQTFNMVDMFRPVRSAAWVKDTSIAIICASFETGDWVQTKYRPTIESLQSYDMHIAPTNKDNRCEIRTL